MAHQMDKILTVVVESSTYGIELSWVKEILTLDNVRPIASSVSHTRGAIMVRGNPIPLVDLRKYFGKNALLDDRKKIVDLLDARRQDHIDWLNELEACVNENRDFKKATDPTKCAFGMWMQGYKPDTPELEREFAAFDEPHREIHAVAEQVLFLAKEGNMTKARERLVEAKEFELKRMLTLFDEVKTYILTSSREIAIIVGSNDSFCGFVVDSVHEIKSRSAFKSEDYGLTGAMRGVSHVLSNDQEPIHILNASEIMKDVRVQSFKSNEARI